MGPKGLYYEEYEIGQKMVTRGRTITEADIVQFAGLTGDYNPMHTDAEFMKESVFGQRIAHGMLTLSYAVGQANQLGFMEGTILAFRGLEMKFSLPVFIGDTLHVELTVSEKKDALRMELQQLKRRLIQANGNDEKLFVMIKPADDANMEMLIDMFDELSVCDIRRYSIAELNTEEKSW